jgi:16S rRNA (cytosine967-C5)-methyltransferase
VTAVDVGAAKLIDAELLCRRAGHPLEATLVTDAAATIPLPQASFDAVLVDAPCTGLGTLRRRPEVRHRRFAADLMRMADLQRRILAHAAPLCRPGGVLVFATCSFAVEEGPLVVDAFLHDHPEFQRDPGEQPWVRPLLDARGDLRTHPLLGGMDAFQAVRLRRRS